MCCDRDAARQPGRIWPDDAPPGTFDIDVGGVQGYPGSTAHILFVCPNHRRCAVLMGPQPVPRPTPDALYVWGWDGNLEQPILTPSINCLSERDGKPAGGCGWHGHIEAGVMRP